MGDQVYLKLRPYRHHSLPRRANEKLSPRFYGPFTVEAKVGQVAYRLLLSPEAQIHPVFHVSQLKRAIGPFPAQPQLPPQLDQNLEMRVEPESVMAIGPTSSLPQPNLEVLVKWKGLPEHDASWESSTLLQQHFPNFHLEDKVSLQPGGIDRPPNSFHLYKTEEQDNSKGYQCIQQ